jgi:hypothetical protein
MHASAVNSARYVLSERVPLANNQTLPSLLRSGRGVCKSSGIPHDASPIHELQYTSSHFEISSRCWKGENNSNLHLMVENRGGNARGTRNVPEICARSLLLPRGEDGLCRCLPRTGERSSGQRKDQANITSPWQPSGTGRIDHALRNAISSPSRIFLPDEAL